MPSDIDCYTEFSIKYLNIDYYSEAERASNLMKQERREILHTNDSSGSNWLRLELFLTVDSSARLHFNGSFLVDLLSMVHNPVNKPGS
jgi:hypothetical protein